MFHIFLILGSLSLPCVTKSEKPYQLLESEVTDNFICRSCGVEITSAASITSKVSTSSSYSFTEPVFNGNEVLSQVLSKDGFELPVITSLQATCVGVGEWQEDETWYPGYLWKPCICSECGAFIGWIFNSSDTDTFQPKTYYTLVLTSIISESCKYELII